MEVKVVVYNGLYCLLKEIANRYFLVKLDVFIRDTITKEITKSEVDSLVSCKEDISILFRKRELYYVNKMSLKTLIRYSKTKRLI